MRATVLLVIPALLGAAPATLPSPAATSAPRRYVPTFGSRADALDAAAAAATNPAERARLQHDALAARVAAAEARIAAVEARRAALSNALALQGERLAAQQGPVMRLVSALTTLARRPAILWLAQPGSVADLVHVEAVLSATLPAARARTAAIRDDLARTRALAASARQASLALTVGRARLLDASETLAAASDDDAGALAAGETARDAAADVATISDAQAVLTQLSRLAGPPVPRSTPPGASAYRLPVAGTLASGYGEVSDNGVKARGLSFAVAPGATVVAPATGRIVYARPFRGFGRIVIIDHGAGWSTLLTGLGDVRVVEGDIVAAGALVGTAGASPTGATQALVSVELRRRGRPVDLTQLLG